MPIETTLSLAARPAVDAELVAVPFGPDRAPMVDLPVSATELLTHYAAKGEPGEIIEIPVTREQGVGRVFLYGIGDGQEAALRRAGAVLARRARGHRSLTVTVPAEGHSASLVEGALLASYTFRIGDGGGRAVEELVFVGGDEAEARRGEAIARATALARDLINTPASVKTPAWLADQAVAVAARSALAVQVWQDSELDPFGGIRAVGRGSASPPRLVRLSYSPEGAQAHVVLVGKGITFDTGGLSLKPTDGMVAMKTDMAGGAAVIAAMSALSFFGIAVRVTGLIACAENALSGSAQRPSDVITQYGGRTVEVMNTDAEGRLVLADALAYADAELNPDVLIDVATLTGAAKAALGTQIGALFATDDTLARALLTAGDGSGDRLWRMPLVEDYRPDLSSAVADLANVGRTNAAGSVTAALFLREFIGARPWAHLDIAGPARAASDDGELVKGGTGFGVRLLLRYLSGLSAELTAA